MASTACPAPSRAAARCLKCRASLGSSSMALLKSMAAAAKFRRASEAEPRRLNSAALLGSPPGVGELDVGDAQPGVPDLLVANREAAERRDRRLHAAAEQAVADPTGDDVFGGGANPDAGGRRAAQH